MSGNQTHTTKTNARPWYKVKMLWLVLLLPAISIVVSLSYVTLSFKSADTVVRDDWYMDGKTLKQDLSRDVLAAELGLKADLQIANSGRLELSLSSSSSEFKVPKQLTLSLIHATEKSGDATARLNNIGNANFLGQLAKVQNLRGKYYFELTDGVWRLRSEAKMPKANITFAPLKVYENPR